MRKMVKGNLKLNVVEHIILRNMWEYYVLAAEPDTHAPDPDIVYALVMGFNDEIGAVSLSEIRPHIISRTEQLDGIMPADGYRWADEPVEEAGGFSLGRPSYLPDEDEGSLGDLSTNDDDDILLLEQIVDDLDEIAGLGPWRAS